MKSYLPALGWVVIITYLSTMPGANLPKIALFSADKLAHAGVYAMLVFLCWFGHRKRNDLGLYWGLATFLAAAVYGALMEWIQATFFPYRAFEYDDMIANTVGAAIGWALGQWMFPRITP